MIKYKVVTADTLSVFETLVNKSLEDGWYINGPFNTVSPTEYRIKYFQPMTKAETIKLSKKEK